MGMDPDLEVFLLRRETNPDDALLYVPQMHWDRKPCVYDPTHTQSERRSVPLQVVAPIQPITDFQWTSYGDIVVTGAIRAAFEAADVSGVKFRPVLTYTSLGDRFEQELYELVPSGWGGVVSTSSGMRVISECPFCRRRVYSSVSDARHLFDVDQWDGCDVFTIWPMPRFVMCVLSVVIVANLLVC